MNFSFIFYNSNKTDNKKEASKLMSDAADSFKKAMQESATQYNDHRKKAEEQISRGAKLTNHRINL